MRIDLGYIMSWKISSLDVSTLDSKNRVHREVTERPPWEDIKTAVLSLDAKKSSCVSVVARDGLILYASRPGYTLVSPSNSSDKSSIIVGGQETILPNRLIVDEPTLLKALRRFADDGELDSELLWEPY